MKLNVLITLVITLLFIQNLSANFNDTLNCQSTDSLALVAFYKNIESELDWDFTKPMENWQGVSLNENGCVSVLSLPGLSLTGTISQEIGLLGEIDSLNLNNNLLRGEIPKSIGNLSSLSYLSLRKNDLNGSIPVELSQLTELEYLSLDKNFLSGIIPQSLGELTHLKYLSLAGNSLAGHLPKSLGNLSSLSYLNLCENNLMGLIPASFGNLTNLETFNLIENNLYGCYFKELKNLCDIVNRQTTVDDDDDEGGGFDDNNFDASWYNFCNYDAGLCTTNNSICRQSDSLLLLKLYENIEGLNWETNLSIEQWEGVYLDGYGCVDGIYIDSPNILNAQLIPEISNFDYLKVLSLNCNLNGEIPAELFELVNLELLDLSGNNLTGSFPSNLENLVNLQSLDFSNNNLSGCFPYEFISLCNSIVASNAFSNNNFDVSWEEFCGTAIGGCCNEEILTDISWENTNIAFFESLYQAENTIEINGQAFVVSDNEVTFIAGEHILINGNFTSFPTSNLIFAIDSCR